MNWAYSALDFFTVRHFGLRFYQKGCTMPCQDLMITNVITVRPDQTVGEAMEVFEMEHIRSVPVVDENNVLVGLFSLKVILENFLPVSAVMEDGLQRLNFVVGAAPGIAKRLRKLKDKTISEVMQKDCLVTYGDTATWEAVRLMARYGSPIPVVEKKSHKLIGLISSQSLLAGLRQILKDMDAGTYNEESHGC